MASTLLNNASTTGAGTALDCTAAKKGVMVVSCSSNFDGDIFIEGTIDNANWFKWEAALIGAKNGVQLVSASRVLNIDVEALTAVRPNLTRVNRGSVTVTGYTESGKGNISPNYQYFSATTTGVAVKSSKGILNSVIIGDGGTGMVVSLFDNASAATTPIGVLKTAGYFPYNIEFQNGLYVVITGTPGNVLITYS